MRNTLCIPLLVMFFSAGTSVCLAQQTATPDDALVTLSKNHVIRSLQLRVADRPDCQPFKQQLQAVGQAADGGNNANFTQDIRKIVVGIKASGCVAQPETVANY